jgi:hypothetical protein
MLNIKNVLLVEIFLDIYPFSEPKTNKDNYIKIVNNFIFHYNPLMSKHSFCFNKKKFTTAYIKKNHKFH